MNYCVPDFEMNDDDSIPTSSRSARQKKSILPEDELVELLWQNGQVVMQSQNQRSFKKCSQKFPAEDAVIPAEVSTAMEARAFADVNEEAANQLFIQEDEMASWLHYPADDSFERDFCTDLLYPSPPGNYASSCRSSLVQEDRRSEEKSPAISRPPIPPTRRMELDSSMKIHNFKHFSRPKSKTESGPSISDKAVRESTVVDSSETPVFRPGSVGKSPMAVSGGNLRYGSMNGDAGAAGMVREFAASEPAVMSSSGGSGARAIFSAEPSLKPPADDKKRKAREADYNDCQSEDVDFESIDAKKQVRGSTSSRRTRAAEVHNLSERKRRDRINEKMKALQELIPRCNKSDKASMLDEAIEYLKSLQLQVQMMSMGCSMVPMMYPGFQPYMSPMGMGMGMSMGMGMGMGMDMGLNRPMLPFPSALAGSSMPTPASAAHLGPRVPMPALHVPPIPATDLSRIQETNQSDPALNAIGRPSPNQPQIPNFADPYQHYHGLHQMQVPPPQNQAMAQPSTSKGVGTLENHQSG